MVQLHSAAAGLPISRPTADVDIVLHIETGAATMSAVSAVLHSLGYELEPSIDHNAPAHRFVRSKQQIDVMVADHLELANPSHRSWLLLEPAGRTPAMDVLRILTSNLQLPPVNRLKKA
jgi:hypothetical protein